MPKYRDEVGFTGHDINLTVDHVVYVPRVRGGGRSPQKRDLGMHIRRECANPKHTGRIQSQIPLQSATGEVRDELPLLPVHAFLLHSGSCALQVRVMSESGEMGQMQGAPPCITHHLSCVGQ